MLVRIVKDWQYPENFFRQIPGEDHKWGDIVFTTDEVPECDYLICLQRPPADIKVVCPKENLWIIMQEPPVKWFDFHKKSYPYFGKVFTYFNLQGENIASPMQPVLPWHINRSYDELIGITRKHLDTKRDSLVWITSNKTGWPGQKARMALKDYLTLKNLSFEFKLYGNGFQFIEDKYDALFPCKYALAIENYSTPDYWTEKLMDCFLSYTLPFYWGAENLEDYFPMDSFIRIDVNNHKEALQTIKIAIDNNEWEKRIESIEKARELVLNKYQFFPFISQMIKEDLRDNPSKLAEEHFIPANKFPRKRILLNQFKYFVKRLRLLK